MTAEEDSGIERKKEEKERLAQVGATTLVRLWKTKNRRRYVLLQGHIHTER